MFHFLSIYESIYLVAAAPVGREDAYGAHPDRAASLHAGNVVKIVAWLDLLGMLWLRSSANADAGNGPARRAAAWRSVRNNGRALSSSSSTALAQQKHCRREPENWDVHSITTGDPLESH